MVALVENSKIAGMTVYSCLILPKIEFRYFFSYSRCIKYKPDLHESF